MKMKQVGLMMVIFLMASSCYAELTGTVIDAETGEPIEGAVVLVEWTVTKGIPGMTHHEIYKVFELETGKDGKFTVPAMDIKPVNPPKIVIYKSGYVAWRNDFIFPGWKKRSDFKFPKTTIIKLEKFREGFSRTEHIDFIKYGIMAFYQLSATDLPKIRMGVEFEKRLAQ